MLILTRYIGQSLKIGDEITITTINTEGNQVKFGIEAPKHIAVDREEIYHRKKNNPLVPTQNQGKTPPIEHNQTSAYTQQCRVNDTHEHQVNPESNPQTNPRLEQYSEAPQLTGNILFIKQSAGYGFIYTPSQDTNIYFHAKDVLHNRFYQLEEGCDVNFRLIEGPRGLIAKNIELL